MTKRKPNNTQIDRTSYYALPSGRQLEDFIADRNLSFAMGSALKYLWRAGKKDGESREKDLAKAEHYVKFKSLRENIPCETIYEWLGEWLNEARSETTAVCSAES